VERLELVAAIDDELGEPRSVRLDAPERPALLDILVDAVLPELVGAATEVMIDDDLERMATLAGGDAGHHQRPQGGRRVARDEVVDARKIRRMPGGELLQVVVDELLFLHRGEGAAVVVLDEQVLDQRMASPDQRGAAAPIVLLAIAAAEQVLVEVADALHEVTVEPHAEAQPRRQLDGERGRFDGAKMPVDGIDAQAQEHVVVAAEIGKAADRRPVRERRGGGHARVVENRPHQPLKPVGRHPHVGVENDGMMARGRQPPVDAGDETEIGVVVDQLHAQA
jgi:hypothetical protein